MALTIRDAELFAVTESTATFTFHVEDGSGPVTLHPSREALARGHAPYGKNLQPKASRLRLPVGVRKGLPNVVAYSSAGQSAAR